MNIVFFGTSEVGLPILSALSKKHSIVKVVTSPDAPVGRKQVITASPIAKLAEELELPIDKPSKVKNNPDFIEELKTLNADIFIVVSYGKILPAELISIPHLKTINIHFSLLPKYRGASPIQSVLLNGEAQTGTTIFILDELVDHGPILAQTELPIEPDDTFSSLAPRLSEASANLLMETLPGYRSGMVRPIDQDHDQASFTKLIDKDQGRIDWSMPAQQIYNQYRAFEAWPGIWTTYQDKKLKILSCSVHDENNADQAGLIIPCGDNTTLSANIIQLEGRNAMTAKEFLNGHPNFNPSDLA